jgi:hypothetical protein
MNVFSPKDNSKIKDAKKSATMGVLSVGDKMKKSMESSTANAFSSLKEKANRIIKNG